MTEVRLRSENSDPEIIYFRRSNALVCIIARMTGRENGVRGRLQLQSKESQEAHPFEESPQQAGHQILNQPDFKMIDVSDLLITPPNVI